MNDTTDERTNDERTTKENKKNKTRRRRVRPSIDRLGIYNFSKNEIYMVQGNNYV